MMLWEPSLVTTAWLKTSSTMARYGNPARVDQALGSAGNGQGARGTASQRSRARHRASWWLVVPLGEGLGRSVLPACALVCESEHASLGSGPPLADGLGRCLSSQGRKFTP